MQELDFLDHAPRTMLPALVVGAVAFHAPARSSAIGANARATHAVSRNAPHCVVMGVDPVTKIWTPDDILWTPAEKGGGREDKYGPIGRYCESLEAVIRRPTRTVTAGPVKFGSEHPIVRQTMGTTLTKDGRARDQVMRCADEASTWCG